MQETQVQSLGQEDPLEEGLAAHCSIPAWRIPWTRRLEVYSSQGYKESHNLVTQQQQCNSRNLFFLGGGGGETTVSQHVQRKKKLVSFETSITHLTVSYIFIDLLLSWGYFVIFKLMVKSYFSYQ